jgi:tRNA A-37 threonylcarbamoyl transferase component Bud32
MAKTPQPPPDEAGKPRKKRPTDPGEPGTETSPDSKLVNALESDPNFFKDPLLGQALGKCKILKFLGQGRTSAVYRATYVPLKRTVAVKVLQPEMTKFPAVVRVFQQEGRAVAALDHENVMKIYDVGEDQGRHYLVLELLHGETVMKKIEGGEGGRLPIDTALDYARQAAAGLAAAQMKNLVHRDIKPQNLVVEPDGVLKIVDFGLAAEAEGAFAGGRLGTPHYMSPEVCKGEPATPASDVYALGITLYHMLTGKPPFAGRKTTEEIVEGHLKGERLQPEKVHPEIPRAVAELVRQMTRQDPTLRPTAQEVVQTISEKLTPERLGARAHVRARRGGGERPRAQKPPMVLIAVGAVVAIILGVLLFSGGGGPKTDDTTAVEPPTPSPAPPPDKEPSKPVIKLPADKQLERDLKELLDQARREETTGNYQEALSLYQRVLVKAPPDSPYAAQAKGAADLVRDRLQVEKGHKPRPERKFITARGSEEAGKEFEARKEEFWRRLADFDVEKVKADAQALVDRTREGTPERAAIEETMAKMRYVESLLGIMQARAASISGEKSKWTRYDPLADREFTIMSASVNGIDLRDDDTGETKTKPWTEIPASVRASFLEALRNPISGTETLWLGAYCLLIGEARADTYFDRALDLDPGLRPQVSALRGGK